MQLAAERLDVGFWTDKGTCDDTAAAFLAKLRGKEVFLFGTAGFGGEAAYFEKMLHQSKLQEKSKNINIAFSKHYVKMFLLVLIKEGLSRVKSNTI